MFTINSARSSSATCPVTGCDFVTVQDTDLAAASTLIRHLNFTHDDNPPEED